MSNAQPPERRELTVMLCDLVGWTSLAQRLDAEELAEVMQAYRRRCGSLVARHGGLVAQYVGDGLLAYFGYPRAHEDDAERAIRAALAIAAAEPAGPSSQGRARRCTSGLRPVWWSSATCRTARHNPRRSAPTPALRPSAAR